MKLSSVTLADSEKLVVFSRPLFFRIKRFFKNLRRSWEYAVFGWSNYDFDYGYMLALLRFKLERVNKFLNGPDAIADHSPGTIRSIKIAARLAKKLENDDYTFFIDRHHTKWRGIKIFEDIEPSAAQKSAGIAKITQFIDTPETKKERTEFMRASDADDSIRKRDARWLFSIMEKYHTSWWD